MARIRLTPDVERQIVATIRAGGFAHIAAEAAGVPRRLFALWLARGRKKRAAPRYRNFWLNVIQAKAQARLGAEMKARDKDPKFWLRYGPGKESVDAPAWGASGKARPAQEGPMANAEFRRLFALVLQVLAPFPEARLAILQALESGDAPAPEEPSPPRSDPTTESPVSDAS